MARKGKTGRPASDNSMVHTAVLLPPDLLERLKRDAAAAGLGLSGEIRRRLEETYALEQSPGDVAVTLPPASRLNPTGSMAAFVKKLADSLAGDLGKQWHESGYVFAAFKGGLAAFLALYTPRNGEGARDVPGHIDNPETVGRTHARLIIAARREADQADGEPKSE